MRLIQETDSKVKVNFLNHLNYVTIISLSAKIKTNLATKVDPTIAKHPV